MPPAFPAEKSRAILLWLVAAVCCALLGVPLLFILMASFRGPAEYLPFEAASGWTFSNFEAFYGERQLYTEILPNTAALAFGSLALACSLAILLAWRFERGSPRGQLLARILILAPMALPTPALALSWIRLLGPNAGWINEALRSITGGETGPLNIFSVWGLIWCQAIAAVPVSYLLLAPAIRAVRIDLEESAYVCGATPGTTFLTVGLPLALRALVGPLLVLSLVSLEQVDFPYILGPTADIQVLGTRIMRDLTSPSGLPNLGGISAAAMLMLTLSLGGILLHDRLTRRIRAAGTSLQQQSSVKRRGRFPSAVASIVLATYVLVALVLPLSVLVVESFGGPLADAPDGWTHVTSDRRFWTALANTLVVATLSALIGTAVGISIAIGAAGRTDRLGRALDYFSSSSIAVPPLVVAFGAAMLFLSIPVGIYGTIGLLVIAYSYRIAVATRMADGALSQLGPSLQEAARVCGAGWIRTQVSIVIPVILPSIVASTAFLFVVGIKEFTIPLMLYSPDNVVLSVLLLQMNQAGAPAAAAATGLVMTAITMAGVAALVAADRRLSSARRTQ